MYSIMLNQNTTTATSSSGTPTGNPTTPPSATSTNNTKRKNCSNAILTISNMYPALQGLAGQDFNKLSTNYPNMIKNQTDLNHLLALYYASNSIYQYINNVLSDKTDLSDVGNEAKYNSQISIYEQFCTHISFFYQKSLKTQHVNTTQIHDRDHNNHRIYLDPDVRSIFKSTDTDTYNK